MELSSYNIIKNIENEYYIFNTFSKAIIKVNGDIYSDLKQEKFSDLDLGLLESLKKNGIVVEDRNKEKAILHKRYKKTRSTSDVLFITLLPTMKCNCRCPYCFEGSNVKTGHNDIDFEVLKKTAQKYFPGRQHIHITLFGGEPLIKWKDIKDLFLEIKRLSEEYGFSYSSSIATNAYLLSKTVCEELICLCHTESFQITIDGCKKTHNKTRKLESGEATFDKVLENFKQLVAIHKDSDRSKKLNVLLRVNLLNNTEEEVGELLDEFSDEEKKYFEVYFRPIYNTKEFNCMNANKANLETFYLSAKRKGFHTHYGNYVRFWHCEGDGGIEQIHVMPDLTLWKCVNDLSMEEARIGSIEKTGHVVMDMNKINEWKNNDPFSDPKCAGCVLLPICWGVCPSNYIKKKKRVCIYESGFDFIDTFIR